MQFVFTRTIEESNRTDDQDLSEPGVIKLEPGVCVYHHINAINLPHLTTPIPVPTICVKGK